MKYRPLGDSGIEASVIGLGTWAIGGWMWGGTDRKDSVRAIHASLDAGANLIDTAPVYGFGVSEEIVGEAISGRRDKVVLATKCGLVWDTEKGDPFFSSDAHHPAPDATQYNVFRYLAPSSIRREVENSLKRLGTDYIDLYQTHWQETVTPIADTMGELLRLKEEGKIRAIGVSNATAEQMAQYRAAGALDSDQENYSMLDRAAEKDQLPFCHEKGVAFLSYSTLGQGLLTGKIPPERTFEKGDQRNLKPAFTRENREKVAAMLQRLAPFAEKHGATLGQLALAWTFRQPGCTHVLVGARTPDQAKGNALAGDMTLPEETLREITKIVNSLETA